MTLVIKKKKTTPLTGCDSFAVRRWSLAFAKEVGSPSTLYKLFSGGKKWRMKKADRIYHANKNVQDAWCKLIGYDCFAVEFEEED